MELIKLASLHEACGACPTHYTGKTVNDEYFDAYLRHGYMQVTIDDTSIVSINPSTLDGVCSFDDFKKAARRNGYVIDDSEAVFTSHYDEMEELVKKLYKDKVWVEFVQDFFAQTQGKQYRKGERYRARIDVADALLEANLVTIDDDSYPLKKAQFENEESNQ